jgi:hypothetical protein
MNGLIDFSVLPKIECPASQETNGLLRPWSAFNVIDFGTLKSKSKWNRSGPEVQLA